MPVSTEGATYSASRCVENYDARLEVAGWQGVTFNDASWTNATVVNRSICILKAQYVAADSIAQVIAPGTVTKTNTFWTVDFGKCYNGWPILTIVG